jgi:ATP adenylyltransferase
VERLWAPWRLEYVKRAADQPACVLCAAATGDDEELLVVHRGPHAFVLLNRYPYAPGHLMVAPLRHVGDYRELTDDEAAEIHALTARSLRVLADVYGPHGFNVGWNLGSVAGGSISAHLHEHVVPRWGGDTNFMPVLADVKVLPEHLSETRRRLAEAWGPAHRGGRAPRRPSA